MANKNDNLIPEAHKLTVEDQSNGGKRSGEVRREKATMKKTLEMMLKCVNKTVDTKETYQESITLGLIANAIDKTKGGSPEAYKTILAVLGELEDSTETPSLNINIVDNSNLEKYMYEEDK